MPCMQIWTVYGINAIPNRRDEKPASVAVAMFLGPFSLQKDGGEHFYIFPKPISEFSSLAKARRQAKAGS